MLRRFDTRARKGPDPDVIEDLRLVWHLTEAEDWVNRMDWLPF